MSDVSKPMQELSDAANGAARSITSDINRAIHSYNAIMKDFLDAQKRAGMVLQNGHWVSIKALKDEERAERWKSYTDDELHDTVDSILDELNDRDKKRRE